MGAPGQAGTRVENAFANRLIGNGPNVDRDATSSKSRSRNSEIGHLASRESEIGESGFWRLRIRLG